MGVIPASSTEGTVFVTNARHSCPVLILDSVKSLNQSSSDTAKLIKPSLQMDSSLQRGVYDVYIGRPGVVYMGKTRAKGRKAV